MAGAGVQIRHDDAEVQEAFRKLRANLVRTQPAMDEIGAAMVTSTQQRFEDERDPDGAPWPPLAESTRRKVSRGRLRGGANKLRVSGLLYQSITHTATPKEVEVGTNRIYAALQQLGGTPSMRNPGARAVPARPYLGLSDADQTEVVRILADHLMEGV